MPRVVIAALWLVFTAVAVVTGLGAVAIVQGAVTGNGVTPLSAEQVSRQLRAGSATAGPTSAPPTSAPPDHHAKPTRTVSTGPTVSEQPTSTSAPAGTVVRTIGSRGGTVVADCSSGQVYLRSWSPAAGFVVDSYSRGPDLEASIRFASAETGQQETEVELTVTCLRGVPAAKAAVGGETD